MNPGADGAILEILGPIEGVDEQDKAEDGRPKMMEMRSQMSPPRKVMGQLERRTGAVRSG